LLSHLNTLVLRRRNSKVFEAAPEGETVGRLRWLGNLLKGIGSLTVAILLVGALYGIVRYYDDEPVVYEVTFMQASGKDWRFRASRMLPKIEQLAELRDHDYPKRPTSVSSPAMPTFRPFGTNARA
jgi:hypothetical protein